MKSLTEDLNVNKNIASRILMGSFKERALGHKRPLKSVRTGIDAQCEICKRLEKLVEYIS